MLRRGVAESEAEDLAQETLAQVWRRADTFDPAKASASAWIFTIARNLRVDAFRRARGLSSLPPQLLMSDDIPEDPHTALDAEETQQRIGRALTKLPPEQLEVLQLSFLGGCTQVETAERLGIPLGTVKSRIRLAIERLRALAQIGERTSAIRTSQGGTEVQARKMWRP